MLCSAEEEPARAARLASFARAMPGLLVLGTLSVTAKLQISVNLILLIEGCETASPVWNGSWLTVSTAHTKDAVGPSCSFNRDPLADFPFLSDLSVQSSLLNTLLTFLSSTWIALSLLLIHGSEDTSVPFTKSKMYDLLQEAGVLSRITIVEGEDHFFDQLLGGSSEAEDAERERKFGNVFDDAASFLKRRIDAAQGRGTVQTRESSRSRSRGRRQ